jgi:hypothetical protein
MRTLVIGRSPFADVVMADPSVATHHAEIVITDDGRLYLTDCASETGTWRLDPTPGGDRHWRPLRQGFVAADEPLMLGEHHCTAGQLTAAVRERSAGDRQAALQQERLERDRPRLRGRVERDAATGEIVRRRP